MPYKIVRNDITKMNTDIIVNTANEEVLVGTGVDRAVYNAAGYEQMLNYRQEYIGYVEQGQVFLTPGFNLPVQYIIHAVSPLFIDGEHGEEEKLRSCYRESLNLAMARKAKSIAFPLIATGRYAYPIEEGLRIAIDEISAFLMKNNMMIYIVVFNEIAAELAGKISVELESYIDSKYIKEKINEEYQEIIKKDKLVFSKDLAKDEFDPTDMEKSLEQKIDHVADGFSDYLLYLIKSKGMDNAQVYKNAVVDKKVFSKIKSNPDYHPLKRTVLCLCIGARLNLQESKDLLARAGYALSPCDKQDIIFSYFIENGIYDMVEVDIQLENHGLECIIK